MTRGSAVRGRNWDGTVAPGDVPFRDERANAQLCEAMGTIWHDEMEIDRVVPADDYFSLGGDSLTAVRIMIRVRAEFGVDLPISVLLEKPTLRDFALHVAALRDSGQALPRPSDDDTDVDEGLV